VQPYFGLLTNMNVSFACGSMVVKKDGFFHPAGGEVGWLSRQTPDVEPTA